ncbi:Hypothetical predicted protein [Olea europaea subsp. europaea]|uniref:Uncharacterized protein n=1 Tax=Olea europaea subsp. europaea TaxID=158383 RepID=A0A8S0RE17_OLEEU|nr:Hypothetical predicted protein [Olea europaea subsp. europaea]
MADEGPVFFGRGRGRERALTRARGRGRPARRSPGRADGHTTHDSRLTTHDSRLTTHDAPRPGTQSGAAPPAHAGRGPEVGPVQRQQGRVGLTRAEPEPEAASRARALIDLRAARARVRLAFTLRLARSRAWAWACPARAERATIFHIAPGPLVRRHIGPAGALIVFREPSRRRGRRGPGMSPARAARRRRARASVSPPPAANQVRPEFELPVASCQLRNAARDPNEQKLQIRQVAVGRFLLRASPAQPSPAQPSPSHRPRG